MRARRVLRRGLAAGVAALLLGACGDSGGVPASVKTDPAIPGVVTTVSGTAIGELSVNDVPLDDTLREVVDELESLEADLDDLDVLTELVEIDRGG